jgi:NADPH-dependent methylglyoxal reductase
LLRTDWDFSITAGKSVTTSRGLPAYSTNQSFQVCVGLEDVARVHVLMVEREEANGRRSVLVSASNIRVPAFFNLEPILIKALSGAALCPSDFVSLFAREFPERAHLQAIPTDLVSAPILCAMRQRQRWLWV